MKPYLSLLLLLIAIDAHSQTDTITCKKSQYRVNVTLTPQFCLNGTNIQNDGIQPEGISTRNTGGFITGMEVERKSKTGFLLSFGFCYGLRHQSVTLGYESLAFYEPSLSKALEAYGPQKEQFSGNTTYWEFRLMAGYAVPHPILHGCHIEINAGTSARTYQTKISGDYYRGITLVKNDTAFDGTIGSGSVWLGGNNPFGDSWWKTVQCNIMLRKDLNIKYLKDISFGLEFSRALFFPWEYKGSDADISSYALERGNYPVSTDKYVSKDYSFGLRFCAGLWYK